LRDCESWAKVFVCSRAVLAVFPRLVIMGNNGMCGGGACGRCVCVCVCAPGAADAACVSVCAPVAAGNVLIAADCVLAELVVDENCVLACFLCVIVAFPPFFVNLSFVTVNTFSNCASCVCSLVCNNILALLLMRAICWLNRNFPTLPK
jgi:hypothetical protein